MPKINIWLLSGKAALNVRLKIYTLLYNPKNQLRGSTQGNLYWTAYLDVSVEEHLDCYECVLSSSGRMACPSRRTYARKLLGVQHEGGFSSTPAPFPTHSTLTHEEG